MKIKISDNFGTKVLSLAIALILWFIIGNVNDPVVTKSFSDIPVQVINEDVLESINKVYEVTEGDTVTVTVRGKKSIVNDLQADDFTAVADLSKLSIVNAVPIDVTISKNTGQFNANQLDITMGRINTLKVRIEDREETMVPVTIETIGTPANGYAIGSKTSSPNMVEVSGSETLVKRLKEIKVQVDVSGASKDISTRQSVKFYDQNGDQVESSTIDCETAAVDVKIELWRTKEISVVMSTSGKVKNGYGISAFEYEPKTVEIAAPDDKLETITELRLDDLDVSGKEESMEQTITLDNTALPNGVIFPSSTVDIVARAVIEKKVTREVRIIAADITVKGLEEGQKAVFDQKSYVIHVDSYQSKLSTLESEAFEPYINVDEIDEETGKVQVHLTNPSGATVTTSLTVEVTIK